MKGEYGQKKGEQVFYASRNKGKIKGVEKERKKIMHKAKRAGFKMN